MLSLVLVLFFALFFLISQQTLKARYKCRHYEITQDQVISYDGILSCKQRISNMKGMVGMEVTETGIGKLLNYGTITLKFLGGGEVNLVNVDKPEAYISKITELVSKGVTTQL